MPVGARKWIAILVPAFVGFGAAVFLQEDGWLPGESHRAWINYGEVLSCPTEEAFMTVFRIDEEWTAKVRATEDYRELNFEVHDEAFGELKGKFGCINLPAGLVVRMLEGTVDSGDPKLVLIEYEDTVGRVVRTYVSSHFLETMK